MYGQGYVYFKRKVLRLHGYENKLVKKVRLKVLDYVNYYMC